jgi:hypothetical protein
VGIAFKYEAGTGAVAWASWGIQSLVLANCVLDCTPASDSPLQAPSRVLAQRAAPLAGAEATGAQGKTVGAGVGDGAGVEHVAATLLRMGDGSLWQLDLREDIVVGAAGRQAVLPEQVAWGEIEVAAEQPAGE